MTICSFRRRRHGFTLVELLVVLGIIALLISILMPALRGAKERGNALVCQSNLRALGQAFMMFAQDHKNCLPANKHDQPPAVKDPDRVDWLTGYGVGWQGQPKTLYKPPYTGVIFYKYLKRNGNPNDVKAESRLASLYLCPTNTSSGQYGMGGGSNEYFDYAVFGSFSGAKVNHIPQQCWLRDPGNNAVLHMNTPIIVQEDPMSLNGPNIEGGHSMSDKMTIMHYGGAYYTTLDGSVQFFREPRHTGGMATPGAMDYRAIPPSKTAAGQSIGLDYKWGDWDRQ